MVKSSYRYSRALEEVHPLLTLSRVGRSQHQHAAFVVLDVVTASDVVNGNHYGLLLVN